MKTNVKHATAARTFEGGLSVSKLTPAQELRRTVMACMLWEDSFYEDGKAIADRIKDLCAKITIQELQAITYEARTVMKLRHVPLLLAREALRNHKGREVGDLIFSVIQRVDEIPELIALYRRDGGKSEPAQLKKGIARAFKKFDAYQLAKYDRDGDIKLRDALFMAHPRPSNDKQKEAFKQLAEGTLPTPDTWETQLSAGADKKETFTRLLQENKLGAMALLRNLRGMIEAGVDESLIRGALGRMKAERVLPFRFITAARYAPRLEDALEGAMFKGLQERPKFQGHTALLIDHSGSMQRQVSSRSEITRFDAAAALAMVLRETAEHARVFTFARRMYEVAPRRGFALIDAVKAVVDPTSTFLGSAVREVYKAFPECNRIIVITDEQSADSPPHPQGKGYIINVAPHTQGIGYGPWVTINGWSEGVLDYIQKYEPEEN